MSFYPLFHFLSLSLTSHLSSLHIPLSFSLTSSSPTLSLPRLFISHGFFPHASSSPSPLYLSWVFPSPLHLPNWPLHLPWVFLPCLFISLTSSSLMDLSPTSSFPQFIAPSISYLNSPLPTAPTIGDTALNFFFLPLCFYGGLCMKDAIFPLLLFDSICGFCDMCYY